MLDTYHEELQRCIALQPCWARPKHLKMDGSLEQWSTHDNDEDAAVKVISIDDRRILIEDRRMSIVIQSQFVPRVRGWRFEVCYSSLKRCPLQFMMLMGWKRIEEH